MSTLISKNVQVGADGTATNNFTIFQPATPDGTLRIGNGNTGITSSLLALTSAGSLGIGTSSPQYKADVAGNIGINSVGSSGNGLVGYAGASPSTGFRFSLTRQDAIAAGSIYLNSYGAIGFGINKGSTGTPADAPNMLLDSSGNLGLGVTPSAWGGGYKAFDFLYGSLANTSAGGVDVALTQNAYYNGTNWIAKYTGGNKRYVLGDSGHLWFTASSTTGNTTISFGDPKMTLDASGRLLVGTTTAVNSFSLQGNLSGNNAADCGISIQRYPNYGSNLYHTYSTTTSSEAFGLSVSDNSAVVDAAKTKYLVGANGTHIWYGSTTSTERARIDSSGNLLVGTTNANENAGVGLKLFVSSTAPAYRLVMNTATGAESGFILYNTNATNNGYRFYVKSDGGIANFSGNNVNLSDERTKKNIEIADSYLGKICAIPVKLFNYKDEAEGEQRTLGVIAQDVEAVAPEFVNTEGWGGTAPEDEVPLKTIYTTDMMFGLMKCIQELNAQQAALNAKLEAQAAEIAALKGQA